MSLPPVFVEPWKRRLHPAHGDDVVAGGGGAAAPEFPDYHQGKPETLISSATAHSFQLGTGASIYTQTLLPALLRARHEVVLVTCFWAASDTLTALRQALEQLAEARSRLLRAQAADGDGAGGPDQEPLGPLRIRIGFSSRSLFQKLFHTSSRRGYVYPPAAWPSQLGLPPQETLEAAAIDLRVKSLFFLPFSVMHPKFMIVDRQRAWLPSCNVSWEPWLEGCVEISGPAVAGLVQFHQSVWDTETTGSELDRERSREGTVAVSGPPPSASPRASAAGLIGLTSIQSPATRFAPLAFQDVPVVLLPSSHHRNPGFRWLPWLGQTAPPATPLNVAMLQLLKMAQHSIYIQTPNLTTTSVIDGIVDALARGVDIKIVTGKNMMLLEQIVTAGTTTSLCLKALIRRHRQLVSSSHRRLVAAAGDENARENEADIDLEAGRLPPGNLTISYFHPDEGNLVSKMTEEPVQSHIKLTIVDGEYTVLGSGNLDRASWFTSQELGILFRSAPFARIVSDNIEDVLKARTATLYDSKST